MRTKPLSLMRRTSLLLISCCVLLSAFLTASQARMTLDGSLGPSGALSGPNYMIPAEVGQLRGSNLFHSFGAFNIHTGESATFTGPNVVDNILSRVTGGSPSNIDGLLRSEIPGANLFLLNPSGILFGPNASLDVQGSFHASTADAMRFADGATFSAHLNEKSTLTVAAPAAFGFLSAKPVDITIQESTLQVPGNESISIIGGDIKISGDGGDPLSHTPNVYAPGGQINITSVASSGEVSLSPNGQSSHADITAFDRLGEIEVVQGAYINVSGEAAGSVVIRSGQLLVDRSAIRASTLGAVDGAEVGLDIHVTEDAIINTDSFLFTVSPGAGDAGDIRIKARRLQGGSNVFIGAGAINGDAGDVWVNVETLTLTDRAIIDSSTFGKGAAGRIKIEATGAVILTGATTLLNASGPSGGMIRIRSGRLLVDGAKVLAVTTGDVHGPEIGIDVQVDGEVVLTNSAWVITDGLRDGNAGPIRVTADRLEISEGSLLRSRSAKEFAGGAGSIMIDASDVEVAGEGTRIDAETRGSGPAGAIEIAADRLTVTEAAQISTATRGPGPGGLLTVIAQESIDIIDNSGGQFRSGLFSNSGEGEGGEPTGNAGNIIIKAPQLTLDGGRIQTRTLGDGNAGNITIKVDRLELLGGGQIFNGIGNSEGDRILGNPGGAGQGGTLTVRADESILIAGEDRAGFRSGLFSSAQIGRGRAGDLLVKTPHLEMREVGRIDTRSGSESSGAAGDLTVKVETLILRDGAQITSTTFGSGQGGKVTIRATDAVILDGTTADSRSPTGVFARSEGQGKAAGEAGAVIVEAKNVMLTGGGAITTEAAQASGGNIEIVAQKLIRLRDSVITATVSGGPETVGGNITIDPEFVILENSRIVSNANQGRGGNINIEAGVFLADPDSMVSAIALNSEVGIDGEVNVEAVATNLIDVVTPLPPDFASAASLLREQCAARLREGQLSSLVISGRAGMPARPGGVLPSPLFRADREPMGPPKQAEPLAEAVASHPEGDGASAQDMRQGWMSFQHGDFEQAARHWQEAVRALEREGEADQQSVALAYLAQAYQKLGHYQQALQSLQAAQTLAEKLGDQILKAFILGELGNVHLPLGLGNQASQYLHDGLRLAREMKADELVAVILNNLGNLFVSQEAFDEALRAYRESARLAQLTGNHALTARALTNAALITLRRGEPQEAQALLDQAFPVLQALSPSHEKAYGLVSIGLVYANLRSHLPAVDASLLQLALRSFNDAAAVAQATSDDRAASYAWGHLGNLYEDEGRYQEALAHTRRAVFAVQHVQAQEASYQWQWQSGRVLNALGQSQAAMAAYRQAIQTLQAMRHEMLVAYGEPLRFRETVEPVYAEFAGLLLQPGASKEALEEARQTLESLKVAELQNYFEDECVAALRLRETSLDEVSQTAVVVYPVLLPDRTELLVSLPTGAGASKLQRFTVLVGADRFTQEVRALRQGLENRTTRQYFRHAQQLYDWLIRPLEPSLASLAATTLVFVPDGALWTIPMAALHDGEQFLIQKYALAITPGLNLTDPRPLQQPARVLAAGLTQSVQGFSSLPYVETELQAIANLYQSDLLLNQDFQVSSLENTLDTGLFPIVHIASHGRFSSDLDDTFILAFNDKLTLERLDQLLGPLRFRDEPIELLTLSACQTAAGDDRAALGLAGVAVRAGARSALATLWYINDQASSELVAEFYRQLRAPSVSRATALQRAQIHLLDDLNYQHPAYWAPFLLINNWL